jgi:hypothetical protein
MKSVKFCLALLLAFVFNIAHAQIRATFPSQSNEGARTIFSTAPIFQFDEAGVLVAAITEQGKSTYEFVDGRIAVVHKPNGVTIKYRYDRSGRFESSISSNGVVHTAVYDRLTNRLLEIDSSNGKKLTFSGEPGIERKLILTGPKNLYRDLSPILRAAATVRKLKRSPVIGGAERVIDAGGSGCGGDDDERASGCTGGGGGGGDSGSDGGGGGGEDTPADQDPGEAIDGAWDDDSAGDGAVPVSGAGGTFDPPAFTRCVASCERSRNDMDSLVCHYAPNPLRAQECYDVNIRLYYECVAQCVSDHHH